MDKQVRTCKICGKTFETNHARKRTCSRECAAEARRRYQREREQRLYHAPDGRHRDKVLKRQKARRQSANASRNLRYAKLREAARRAEEWRAALLKVELWLGRICWRDGIPSAVMEDLRAAREMIADIVHPPAPTPAEPPKKQETLRDILEGKR